LKNIITLLKNKLAQKSLRKFLFFTIFKYVEYAITAGLLLLLARMVGPEEYGKATSTFLTISYAAFALLGVNQVLVKWYSIPDNIHIKHFLIQYNLFYNLIISVLVLGGISIFLDNEFKYFAAGIATLKLIQEAIVNINRARQNIFKINIIYLSFAFVFLILFSLFVTDINSFFFYWLISIAISSTLGCLITLTSFRLLEQLEYFFCRLKTYWKTLVLDGVKLALMGAILPLFLTLDRLVLLNFSQVSEFDIGNMQLADNIATVVSFGFSSLFFITTPLVIEKLKSGSISVAKFYNFCYRITLGLFILLIISVPILILVINILFENYTSIQLPLILYLFGRLLYLAFYAPSMLCITFSKETNYLKIIYFWFLGLILVFGFLFFAVSHEFLIWLFPLTLVIILFFVHFHFFFLYRSTLRFLK